MTEKRISMELCVPVSLTVWVRVPDDPAAEVEILSADVQTGQVSGRTITENMDEADFQALEELARGSDQ